MTFECILWIIEIGKTVFQAVNFETVNGKEVKSLMSLNLYMI